MLVPRFLEQDLGICSSIFNWDDKRMMFLVIEAHMLEFSLDHVINLLLAPAAP